MARLLVTALVAVVVLCGCFYQSSLKPELVVLGYGRVIEPVGNTNCKMYSDAEACEKLVLHAGTGLLYMACSTQENRMRWMPALGRLHARGKLQSDYVAVFDPATAQVTRLQTQGFASQGGLSLHGMDVVHSKQHPADVLIYLVNHRETDDPLAFGADSVVEVFRTRPGSSDMYYVRTFRSPVIATPNDIVGSGEDESFFFTNDHGFVKSGLARRLNIDSLLGQAWSNVGYCHAEEGCKVAVASLFGANGIAKVDERNLYVGSSKAGRMYFLERQDDNSLVVRDVISLDRLVDNLSVDQLGSVWAAGVPHPIHFINVHLADPRIESPSSALRITPGINNTDNGYVSEKYRIEKIFEDDGRIASGSTSVVYDSLRKKLYLHGIAAAHLTVCDV